MKVNNPVPALRGGGGVKVGGVQTVGSGLGAKPRIVTNRKKKECTFNDEGVCNQHGVLGTKKWKPTNVLTAGEDGMMKYEYKKVNYFVCDVEPRGKGRPGQKRLSSMKTTSPRTPIQSVNRSNMNFTFSTSKEGQSTPVRKQTDGSQPDGR